MKDILTYFSLFMWRLMYLEKRDVQLNTYETNYSARQFNKFISILVKYRDFLIESLTQEELDNYLETAVVDLADEPVVSGDKIGSVEQFKVPTQLIDGVMRTLNELSYLETIVDLNVIVIDNDPINQDIFKCTSKLMDACMKLRDYFESCRSEKISFPVILKAELPVEVKL